MYTPEMRASIERLTASRSRRMKEEWKLFTPDEKKTVLEQYHPDYRPGTMRAITVGPSKGQQTPHELADLFEAYPAIDPASVSTARVDYDVDVLVVGGGGAGAAAALVAQEAGANVLLVTKLRLGDANTMMAQGGIQCASKPTDTPAIHYLDVIGGGGYHNVPELVAALVGDAPDALGWLEELGVMFDKETDGTMVTIHGGGTSRRRMHACRDYTGAEIMRTLRDEVQNRGIACLEYSPVLELFTDEAGAVTGALLVNLETGERLVVRARTTILATGGSGRLHIQGFPTTNHYGATADGLVLAYRAGGALSFLDTIQYHPTGVAFPEQILGQLITEKVRGLGAHLVNDAGDRFVYELETRDAVASAIIRECQERRRGVATLTDAFGVWLDTPLIDIVRGPGTVQRRLPAMFHQFIRLDIDMSKEPILTYPTQHYQNGGIRIDDQGATGIPGLFVAGEASGGVHGRNRLMGNSLLDVIVFGRRAGRAAAEAARTRTPGALTVGHVVAYVRELEAAGVPRTRVAPMVLPDYRRPELRLKKLLPDSA